MNEFLAAVIGATAVIVVPTVGWLSQRLTRESRLLLRIDRLGAAYAIVPDSEEKKELEKYVLRAASDLNLWLDPGNKSVRYAQRVITWGLFGIAVAGIALWTQVAGIRDIAVTIPVGIGVGVVVGLVSLALGLLAERAILKRQSRRVDGHP